MTSILGYIGVYWGVYFFCSFFFTFFGSESSARFLFKGEGYILGILGYHLNRVFFGILGVPLKTKKSKKK